MLRGSSRARTVAWQDKGPVTVFGAARVGCAGRWTVGDGAAGLTVPRGASGPQTVTGDGAVVLTVPRGVPVPQREAGKGTVGLAVPRAVARGPLSRG